VIDQGKGSPLLKYEAQILNPLPPNAETLIWYGPPETLKCQQFGLDE
jgi:hypothetical protein